MTAVTCNGVRVLEARVELPRIGTWVADLSLDAESVDAVTGSVALRLSDSLTLTGTTTHVGEYHGRVNVRAVGGAGGFTKPVTPRDFRLAPARIPVVDTLGEGGESLSSTSSASPLARLLASWTRAAGTVGDALTDLTRELDVAWRVLPDGSTWLGLESWPATKATEVQVLAEDAKAGWLTVSSAELDILPGTTLDGRRLSRVVHHVQPDNVETEVWIEAASEPTVGDRVFGVFASLVERIMRRVDYHALYGARVVAQNGDGSLDLLPDDPRMPSKASVPIRTMPGVKLTVAAGSRVLLGFENGDPGKPIAATWEQGGLVEIAFGGGVAPVARQGDIVSTSVPPLFPILATINLIPPAPGTPITSGSSVLITTNAPAPLPLTGIIITGAGKVKA